MTLPPLGPEHVAALLAIIQARVWPQMGYARLFVDPGA